MKPNVRETLKFGSHVALRNSFILTGLYAFYFALAKLLGFAHMLEFRFVNYLIAFVVAYYTIKSVYSQNNYYIEYFSGLVVCMLVVTLGSFWYSILFFIYLNIDHNFLNYLVEQMPRNMIAPTVSISALVFSEGLGLSPVIALILMQYFKWTSARWTHTA